MLDRVAAVLHLTQLPEYIFPVYVSSGCEERGRAMAAVCQRAHQFFSRTLQAQADITVLVLAPAQWLEYTTYPTYGMPHADTDQQILIMPGLSRCSPDGPIPSAPTFDERQ